jgi:hypothetical protein
MSIRPVASLLNPRSAFTSDTKGNGTLVLLASLGVILFRRLMSVERPFPIPRESCAEREWYAMSGHERSPRLPLQLGHSVPGAIAIHR